MTLQRWNATMRRLLGNGRNHSLRNPAFLPSRHGRVMSRAYSHLSSQQIEAFQKDGYLDTDQVLVNFDTLHNMQVRGCKVFEQKNLFGTHNKTTSKFDWMTFQEFGDHVDRCRAVLKDLGEFPRAKKGTRRDLKRATLTLLL